MRLRREVGTSLVYLPGEEDEELVDKIVHCKVTTFEHDELFCLAKCEGVTVSAFVRQLIIARLEKEVL